LLDIVSLYALLVVMSLVMKAMVMKAFNIPDKYDGEDDNDGDEGEDNGDGDGDGDDEEYMSATELTLAQRP